MTPILISFLLLLAESIEAKGSSRVVLTLFHANGTLALQNLFHDANGSSISLLEQSMGSVLGNASLCCTLVKQYGRRLVWDIGRAVDMDTDAWAIREAWNTSGFSETVELVDIEVDHLVSHELGIHTLPNVSSQEQVIMGELQNLSLIHI